MLGTRYHFSACSGLIGASLGTPADVVKARIMNQPTDGIGRWVKEHSIVQTKCVVKSLIVLAG